MATKHSNKSPASRRNSNADQREGHKPARDVPEAVLDAIELERRKLQQADSMLACLILALQEGCESDNDDDPDYSDVARAVRGIVRSVTERLDMVNLVAAESRPAAHT